MKNWKKRRTACSSIKDVVLANTGMTEEDLFKPKAFYRIDRLDEAAAMISDFVQRKEPITVIADYDGDGICSSAIMFMTLMAMGIKPKIRIPKRFSEGYGMSVDIVNEIDRGLVITVDNGITAHDAIRVAKEKGLSVVLTDHHLPVEDGTLPNADVIIDPNAIENSADFNGYCGAGLAFRLAKVLLGDDHRLIPILNSFAAIATITDVMSLTEENRFIVREGLKHMVTPAGRTTGLGALLSACDFDQHISAKNIAFKIGPILNAPGRMQDNGAMQSVRQLVFNGDPYRAMEMANALIEVNEQRKKAKEEGLAEIKDVMTKECLFGETPLCVYVPNLHEGLVGIFAGSLAEEYKTPCFVFTDSDQEGILKGSARSYGNFHLKNFLDANADVLYKYGGHAEAAGVSVCAANYETMKQRFLETADFESGCSGEEYYDLELSADDIPKTIKELEEYGPYGEGNPEPVFKISDYALSPGIGGCYKLMGNENQHIKFFGVNSSAIGFGMTKEYENLGSPNALTLLATLSSNYFRGKVSFQAEIVEMDKRPIVSRATPMASLLARQAFERNR